MGDCTREKTMRVLTVLCGVAVLLVTLAYGHLLHHYFVNTSAEAAQNPVFWLSFSFGVGVGIFSFIGGAMLVRRGR
jgi:hypothetical protein